MGPDRLPGQATTKIENWQEGRPNSKMAWSKNDMQIIKRAMDGLEQGSI